MNDNGSVRREGKVRCAIYTRKSSEEGLEQAFNSLDAQREASKAYVRSQKHEGWVVLPDIYDDGGISGGTMERPALKRLLTDIEAGRVDTVVVYKVDRLTRSLGDFSKIVAVFDARGVSFVSITQQFNTTTSMGRLTLNMLLSFAQFEREVTGERIRDKVAASKKKGMWMGGVVPLGYDVTDRKLIINEEEAERVRHIYHRYIELGSVRLLEQELKDTGIFGKARPTDNLPLGRGALYRILSNRLYRGEVHHNGNFYPGEHAAIIDLDLWNAAAARLSDNRHDRTVGTHALDASPLAGILFDGAGMPMTPSHAVKGGKRYRYYVSRDLITGSKAETPLGRRIPAGDIETLVTRRLVTFLANTKDVHDAISPLAPDAWAQEQLIGKAAELAKTWCALSPSQKRVILILVLTRIVVHQDRVDLHVRPEALVTLLRAGPTSTTKIKNDGGDIRLPIIMSIPASLKRAGIGKRMIIEGSSTGMPDRSLVKLLIKVFDIRDKILRGDGASLEHIASRESINSSYATRLLRLAFLSPQIVRDILEGRHPPTLTTRRLLLDTRLPLTWNDQLPAIS